MHVKLYFLIFNMQLSPQASTLASLRGQIDADIILSNELPYWFIPFDVKLLAF